MKEKIKRLRKSEVAIILIIIAIILIDQISKIVVQNVGNIDVVQNTNPAYGIGSNSTFMYVITNLIIIAIIAKFMVSQNQFVDMKLKIFLSFIIAGGISNVIDRILRGYVVEWINFKWCPVFNIADLIVLLGWILVAANLAGFTVKEWRLKKANKIDLEDENKK